MNVIRQSGQSKLVEWRDGEGIHRVVLPIESDDVTQGIPYGQPWEAILSPTTPDQKARALRERGIWSAEDLRANVKQVRAALQDLIGTDLAALLDSTREV